MINNLKSFCERKNNEEADDFGDGGEESKQELQAIFNEQNNQLDDQGHQEDEQRVIELLTSDQSLNLKDPHVMETLNFSCLLKPDDLRNILQNHNGILKNLQDFENEINE